MERDQVAATRSIIASGTLLRVRRDVKPGRGSGRASRVIERLGRSVPERMGMADR